MNKKEPFVCTLTAAQKEEIYGETTHKDDITIEGNKYQGDTKGDNSTTPHGWGKLTYSSGIWAGATYEGHFFDGHPHGTGLIIWANRNYYEGDWVQGKRTGNGSLFIACDVVTGRFKDGHYLGPN